MKISKMKSSIYKDIRLEKLLQWFSGGGGVGDTHFILYTASILFEFLKSVYVTD